MTGNPGSAARRELFISDPHGEYVAFSHILRSACGTIRAEIDAAFGDSMQPGERAELAELVYYPHEKAPRVLVGLDTGATAVLGLLGRLVMLYDRMAGHATGDAGTAPGSPQCASAAEAAHIMEEGVVPSETDLAALIADLCLAIQRLSVTRLHMLGDVYDRGPAPELIMDELDAYHSVDIQWGNHDIVWMGASLGQSGCIAHVVRNCARYANLSILEDAYSLDLSVLRRFAAEAYRDDPCVGFALKGSYPELSPEELDINVRIQKAMAIIQFKVEAALIDENPSFGLENRKLLHTIDLETGTFTVDGVEYELTDRMFPTVDWNDPYALTEGEEEVVSSLAEEFLGSERLQRHVALLLEKGSLYKIDGDFLMFHACVPLAEDGTPMEVDLFGNRFRGRALFDAVDGYVRDAFTASDDASRKRGADLLWYLWLGEGSPLFAKSKMATFEIYLASDKAARKEVKNPFYSLLEDASVMKGIFEDFGMDPKHSRIVCGHVPVKVKDGEDPVKCGGRLLIIDGGMSPAYQSTTGIAGLTLIDDRCGLRLVSHEPFESREKAIELNLDMVSTVRPIEALV